MRLPAPSSWRGRRAPVPGPPGPVRPTRGSCTTRAPCADGTRSRLPPLGSAVSRPSAHRRLVRRGMSQGSAEALAASGVCGQGHRGRVPGGDVARSGLVRGAQGWGPCAARGGSASPRQGCPPGPTGASTAVGDPEGLRGPGAGSPWRALPACQRSRSEHGARPSP